MRAPHLNRQLVLEAARRSPDGAGGWHEEWEALGTLWAAVSAGRGRERADGALTASRVPLKIAVRATPHGAPSRPGPGQRFREGGRVFRIHAVTERDPAGRFLTCHATEEVAS